MSVSAEQVLWCYRLLLGREPESQAVVQEHVEGRADAGDLIRTFLGSREFANLHPELTAQPFSFNRVDAPPIRIDVHARPGEMAQLLSRVQACWDRLGRDKPHWSVMSDAQFLPENIGDSLERFWDSGEQDLARLRAVFERIGFAASRRHTCVEYGCGLGRVTTGLAGLFGRVHAYDISPAHLGQAQARAGELGLGNVSFHSCADRPLAPLQPCHFYYSNIVLQHNPPPLIARLIGSALESLKPSGVAVFQVPTYISGYSFDLAGYLDQPAAPDAGFEIHCLPQAVVFEAARAAGCNILEVHEDGAAGSPGACISNTFVLRKKPRFLRTRS